MTDLDVPDLNVWLALADPDHQHHSRARHYWEHESLSEFAFCRLTMLGLLRLLTHPKVMSGDPLTVVEAWAAYDAFAKLPECRFIEDSELADHYFAAWTKAPAFAVHRWTDAWIAAIARSANARAVSFDADFATFGNLRFLHLNA
jgi:toxin-antitoxin system PIN domain toxin